MEIFKYWYVLDVYNVRSAKDKHNIASAIIYRKAMQLVEKSIYSNFSELVRSGLRREIKKAHVFLEKVKKHKV